MALAMTDCAFTSVGSVITVEKRDSAVDFVCKHGRVRVTVLADGIVRVRATRATELGPDFSYAVARKRWPKTPVRITAGIIRTRKLVISITKSPLRIAFATLDGTVLNRDNGRGMGWEGAKCRSHRWRARDEMFFGCGESAGPLNKRGSTTTFWNTDDPNHTYATEALYVSIPFLISTRPGAHYGIFWDNTHRTRFNLAQVEDEKQYVLESDAGEIDYYFFAGDSIREVVRGFTELTGRMWMPPRWALGYQQSRWSYMSTDEIMDIARSFRERKIPCDAIYCDIDYMDGYRVFTWNPKTFPKPRAMTDGLRKIGFKLVTIIDPGVKNDNGYSVCRDGKKKGMFLENAVGGWFTGTVWPGECLFPDFTNPRVRAWWGLWHKELLDLGVAGIWNDMNEPAVWNHPGGTMPLDIPHEYDGQHVTHARAHNVYGFNMARACHEALRKLRPDERPFVITRAAYAGIQRYSMVWTGDNQSLWEQFAVSIPECLNLSLSGVPFCGADVGGFGRDCTGELLARWTQAGAFFPFFRNHTAVGTRQQEPWAFGMEIEDICRAYIRLRYRLLPYLYNLFREAALDGTPIMRPLFWEFPDDPHGYAIDDQFLLGPSLLIAPIVKPGATARAVYLPKDQWYDYWTKQHFKGGQYIAASAPLDRMPLFVRAGSILPMTKPIDHTGQKTEAIILDVYPGPKTVGYLYEDDGATFDYKRSRYSLTRFEWADGKLRIGKRKAGYQSAAKLYRVLVAGREVRS